MIKILLEYISEQWSTIFGGPKYRPKLHFVAARFNRLSTGSTILFCFVDGALRPGLIAKIAGSSGRTSLSAEYEILTKVKLMMPEVINKTVPEVYGKLEMGKYFIVLMEYCPGISILERMRRRVIRKKSLFQQDIDLSLNWLKTFQQATLCEKVKLSAILPDLLKIKDNYINQFKPDRGVLALIKKSEIKIDELADFQKIPLCWTHGDFVPRNILCSHRYEEIKIIDWEFAKPSGIPFFDLFHYLVFYAGYNKRKLGKVDFTEGFQRFFIQENPDSSFIRKSVENYFDSMHVNANLIYPFFIYFLMDLSVKEWNRYVRLNITDIIIQGHIFLNFIANERNCIFF